MATETKAGGFAKKIETKVSPQRRVTIPANFVMRLGLKPGEKVKIIALNKAVVVVPSSQIRKDHEWFWTSEWQTKELEADRAIACGEVTGPFDKIDDALSALRDTKI
jgi:AbrB family looped-hinge helix DNA binding protein